MDSTGRPNYGFIIEQTKLFERIKLDKNLNPEIFYDTKLRFRLQLCDYGIQYVTIRSIKRYLDYSKQISPAELVNTIRPLFRHYRNFYKRECKNTLAFVWSIFYLVLIHDRCGLYSESSHYCHDIHSMNIDQMFMIKDVLKRVDMLTYLTEKMDLLEQDLKNLEIAEKVMWERKITVTDQLLEILCQTPLDSTNIL